MAVKIRLARRGRKQRPFYHIVVADARAPRDGKFIEKIGVYNPMTKPATIDLDRDKAYEWLTKGAQPTDTARAILRFKGVLYRKHLMRGVNKGALTEEKAMEMYNAWIDEKESKIAARVEETRKEQELFWKQVSGEVKKVEKVQADEETVAAFREEGAEETTEAPAEEAAAPAEETALEASAEEAAEAPAANAEEASSEEE